jgi:protein TonB
MGIGMMVLLLGVVSSLAPRPAEAAKEEMPTFEMEEVTVTDTKISKPVLVQEVKPEYPMVARKAGVQGTCLFKIQVLADGTVGEVQLLQSAGDPTLDEAAQKAVKQWKFKPGLSGSKPITVWMTVPIKFELIKD